MIKADVASVASFLYTNEARWNTANVEASPHALLAAALWPSHESSPLWMQIWRFVASNVGWNMPFHFARCCEMSGVPIDEALRTVLLKCNPTGSTLAEVFLFSHPLPSDPLLFLQTVCATCKKTDQASVRLVCELHCHLLTPRRFNSARHHALRRGPSPLRHESPQVQAELLWGVRGRVILLRMPPPLLPAPPSAALAKLSKAHHKAPLRKGMLCPRPPPRRRDEWGGL